MEKLLGTLKKGLVFVISAPAGTGKTTLVRMLVDEFPVVKESISCTTRAPRPGEIPDKDYHFLSKSAFEAKIAAGEFLEHAEVFGTHYGTLRSDVLEEQNKGHHVVLVIDTQGALELKKSKFPAIFIFVQPPSLAELRQRLFKRQTEKDEHIEERLSWAEGEIEKAKLYDYNIVNDNLHRAFELFRCIVIAEEHKNRGNHG
jgi:guanylate kinase